jgi:hypothetical protein
MYENGDYENMKMHDITEILMKVVWNTIKKHTDQIVRYSCILLMFHPPIKYPGTQQRDNVHIPIFGKIFP